MQIIDNKGLSNIVLKPKLKKLRESVENPEEDNPNPSALEIK